MGPAPEFCQADHTLLRESLSGERQIPGAGAYQKAGSVSPERQLPQAPLDKPRGQWGLGGCIGEGA